MYPTIQDYTLTLSLPPVHRPFHPALPLLRHATLLPPLRAGRAHWGAGSNVVVYKFRLPDNRVVALRCFLRAPEQNTVLRYYLLENYLHSRLRNIEYLVNVHYYAQAICVKNAWRPVIVMDWIDGVDIHTYIGSIVRDKKQHSLFSLVRRFARMAQQLALFNLAHGDISHNNVFVSAAQQLYLIDYDAMFVPGMHNMPRIATGTAGYYHPCYSRSNKPFVLNANTDRFPVLVILTSLCALAAFPDFWQKYSKENLLFRENDLHSPQQSSLFEYLINCADSLVRQLAVALRSACLASTDTQLDLNHLLEAAANMQQKYVNRSV